MLSNHELKVTSHVGRDLLASAAAFRTEAPVVWEYVVNSLQYVDPGISPRVQVQVRPRKREIVVSDNGRGMSSIDLQLFFKMHGENVERLSGRTGRGKFGTGKSAIFGIANCLRVDTTRNGKRNVVVLTRNMIENTSGGEIPLQWDIKEESTTGLNGTIITIEDIIISQIRQQPIIEYVERHLQAFRASSPKVAINNHICEYREPEIASKHRFQPLEAQKKIIGDVELIIKAACAPLTKSEQGVAVTSGVENLVAIESCGIEAKEFGNYLLGDVDVPVLETYDSPIQPYDPSRSLLLNPNHPVVAKLLGFIGSKLEEVRSILVKKSREARKTEQARRLALEAEKIANILNDDFKKISEQLKEIRAASSRKGSATAQFGSQDTSDDFDIWVDGTQEPGDIAEKRAGDEGTGSKGRQKPDIASRGEPDERGSNAVDPVGGGNGKRKRPKGGFRVEYKHLGESEDRSRYDSTTLTILINLDHPLVNAALGEGRIEDPTFRRLSYEIAFSEYAMGFGYEISRIDPHIQADDLLYEVRSTLNRVSIAAVSLYR